MNNKYTTSYDSISRFVSYWHQINEILQLKPRRLLEIGIGSGFVNNYLKKININITTLDIDKNLNPNVIGNVLNIPFRDNCFDTVVAFEVLEHLSHNSFSQALSELLRVTSSNVILSLPDSTKVCSIKLKIPKVIELKILIPVPHLKRPDVADAEHYWEIGTNGFLLKKIIHDIEFNRGEHLDL